MAWSNRARFSTHLIRQKTRRYHAVRPDNPHGVPSAVMRALQFAQLPIPDKDLYSRKLLQLMQAIEHNGG